MSEYICWRAVCPFKEIVVMVPYSSPCEPHKGLLNLSQICPRVTHAQTLINMDGFICIGDVHPGAIIQNCYIASKFMLHIWKYKKWMLSCSAEGERQSLWRSKRIHFISRCVRGLGSLSQRSTREWDKKGGCLHRQMSSDVNVRQV